LGANEATTIQTDKALKVEGKIYLPANTLCLRFPAKEWQIIFNSQVGQWGIKRTGEANFDPANNVLTVNVKPKKSAEMNERMKIDIVKSGISVKWENLEVPIGVK
jgi:hypothetical protein